MSETISAYSHSDTVPFRLHPRVFAALGSELVTNDIVAIIELVKNSYDAFATRVDVRLCRTDEEQLSIEIEDNGDGMTRSVIENVWCVVATPHKLDTPFSTKGERRRRVSGEKGLGRLSAARLGQRLELITQAEGEPCWQVIVDWEQLAKAQTLEACDVKIRECSRTPLRYGKGTLVRILDLHSEWDAARIQELNEQLSRLVSPFEESEDFEIYLASPGEEAESVEIKPPPFLSEPPYLFKGHVDVGGKLTGNYRFSLPSKEREEFITEQLPTAKEDHDEAVQTTLWEEALPPRCGPFDFEIRAWDIDPASIEKVAERFSINKSTIRGDIRNYRGLSLYRDHILVLPKSETARDWLGLDLRRVSKVGTRLSTSQVVGYVAITAEKNPDIKDTSDRERLEDNSAAVEFRHRLKWIIQIMEDQRSRDRQDGPDGEQPFTDLFADLSPEKLLDSVNQAVAQGDNAAQVLPLVQEYGAQVQKTIDQIERRLVYYSRLASIGVLTSLIVHEVRNHTFIIGGLTRKIRKLVDAGDSWALMLEKDLNLAERGVQSLQRMADRFAPLASRAGRTRRRDSSLCEIIEDCLAMRETELNSRRVTVEINVNTEMVVAVDPGELIAIFINLLDNSLYWLSSVKDRPRHIRFHAEQQPNTSRVYVQVDDSGPGVPSGDESRVFWPGITRKSDGLGMGLTVASEIVAQYRGKMRLVTPGVLDGASFGFDLPLVTRKQ